MMAVMGWVRATTLVAVVLAACASPAAVPSAAPSAAAVANIAPSPARTAPAPSIAPSPARTAPAPSGQQGGGRAESASLPSCAQGALFSVIPMDPKDFRAFRPLGFPQPPIHILGAKHSNFTINLPGEPVVSGRPVRFPSDAWVTEIVSTESGEGTGYQVTFYPCRDFKSYLFHLGTIAAPLAAELKGKSPVCQDFDFGASGGKIRKCTAKMTFKVSAGDPVGGSDHFGGVDWGGVDFRVSQPFINLSRYDGDYPHYVSPVDYTTPEVHALFEPKLGSLDGRIRRTAEPKTGTLLQDLAGTAQGNWFTPGTNFMNTQDFSPWLALLHDYVDPSLPVVSMGSSVKGLKLGLYAFAPEKSGTVNRDFADVRPDGKTYCYEGFMSGQTPSGLNLGSAGGVILLSMPTAATLRVELQTSVSCATARAIGAAATTFER